MQDCALVGKLTFRNQIVDSLLRLVNKAMGPALSYFKVPTNAVIIGAKFIILFSCSSETVLFRFYYHRFETKR